MERDTSILLIDDELSIRRLLKASMDDTYRTLEAQTGNEGLRLIGMNNPNLILLDLGLPDIDGLQLIYKIREFSKIPIIVISARDREGDKVTALDAGANDYLTKPFGMEELHARIRVALRAVCPIATLKDLSFGDISVHFDTRKVIKGDNVVHLTPTEYRLFLYFIKYQDKVLTHKQILVEIWGSHYARQTQYLRVYMTQLRHKLEDNPARPKYFVTEIGIGYRFVTH